jgi:hypothetical protein
LQGQEKVNEVVHVLLGKASEVNVTVKGRNSPDGTQVKGTDFSLAEFASHMYDELSVRLALHSVGLGWDGAASYRRQVGLMNIHGVVAIGHRRKRSVNRRGG